MMNLEVQAQLFKDHSCESDMFNANTRKVERSHMDMPYFRYSDYLDRNIVKLKTRMQYIGTNRPCAVSDRKMLSMIDLPMRPTGILFFC